MNTHLPGGMSHHQFLQQYWQQKPLLIRQAFPHIRPPCTPAELAGLCCDTDISARLVIEQGETHWQLIQSPLNENHFLELPDTHWTLLVNDFELYYPELLEEIIQHFRFIPDWRIDDLMISYAPEGGSVGPHIDEYDVFLIQVAGERRWQLDPQANSKKLLANTDLAILAEFNAQQDWTLKAGDMLYLPPKLAHYGIAEPASDDYGCMTYSVGFRAPNQQELLDAWLHDLIEHHAGLQRYSDQNRKPQEQPGRITTEDLQGLKNILLDCIDQPDQFSRWLGCYLTQPKASWEAAELAQDNPPAATVCFRRADSRIAWIEHSEYIQLFTDGNVSTWPISTKEGIEYLCSQYYYNEDTLNKLLQDADFIKLYQHLHACHFLQSHETVP